MKKVFLLAIAALVSVNSFAQYEAKMEQQNVIKGSVIVNGEKIDGYIKKKPTVEVNGEKVPAMYLLQEDILFIEKNTFETIDKIKGKNIVKYSPKDCDGFYYGDYCFETRKFCIDPTAMGTNAIPKKIFLHVLKQYDKVTFYAFYDNTGNTSPDENGLAKLDPEKVAEHIKNPAIAYYLTGADRAKNVCQLNAKKELADCPAILEKVANKMYKVDRTADDNYKLFGIATSTNSEILAIGDDNRNLNILEDYINGICE